jgi:hypothetical protein
LIEPWRRDGYDNLRFPRQESVAALIVLIAFGAILSQSAVGSARYYGCLLILVGTGFIASVVWSYALSYRLLRSHQAGDAGFWREAFHAQARLLRLVPLWYCAPIGLQLRLVFGPVAVYFPVWAGKFQPVSGAPIADRLMRLGQ